MFSKARLWAVHSASSCASRAGAASKAAGWITAFGLLVSGSASARVGAPTIYPGDFSDAVGCVQGALNRFAGQHLAEDKHFGPATKAAVQNVQRLFNLDADGIVGPLTGDAINTVVVYNGTEEDIRFWNWTCLQVVPTTEGLGTP